MITTSPARAGAAGRRAVGGPPALGTGGRRFESCHLDNDETATFPAESWAVWPWAGNVIIICLTAPTCHARVYDIGKGIDPALDLRMMS